MNEWKDPRAVVVILLVLVVLIPVIAASFEGLERPVDPPYVYDTWKELLIGVVAVVAGYIGGRPNDPNA